MLYAINEDIFKWVQGRRSEDSVLHYFLDAIVAEQVSAILTVVKICSPTQLIYLPLQFLVVNQKGGNHRQEQYCRVLQRMSALSDACGSAQEQVELEINPSEALDALLHGIRQAVQRVQINIYSALWPKLCVLHQGGRRIVYL